MTTHEQQAETVKKITVFCIEHQGRCFPGWSAPKIFKFIAFHLLNHTLFVTRNIEGQITGVSIAWTAHPKEILRRAERGLPQFAWGLPEPGKALFISEVFGCREVCAELWQKALDKWPHVKRAFTYRHSHGAPRLVELKMKTLNRFYGRT